MKKKIICIFSITALLALSATAVFAWYDNNLETSATSNQSVVVSSSGALQVAFAHDSDGNLLRPETASYSSSVSLDFSGGVFDDITGDGTVLFLPSFDVSGNIITTNVIWDMETANEDSGGDNAALSTDKGKYAYIDLFFKSDVPMEIHLRDTSSLSPKTASNGSDLTNTSGKEGLLQFSDFPNGLPSLNINQSSYGLFSRNLIAGASRVSFNEYTFSYDSIMNTLNYSNDQFPDLVWVPNSMYELTTQTDKNNLCTFSQSGTKESTYTFYSIIDGAYTKCEVIRDSSAKLMGALVREQNGVKEYVPNTILVNGELKPAYADKVSGTTVKKTAIHTSAGYVTAVLYNNVYYQVQYDSTYTNYAYLINSGGTVKTAIAGKDENDTTGFVEAYLDGTEYKKLENGTFWLESQALALMTQADDSTYETVEWIENTFVSSTDGLYNYTQSPIVSTSFSYVSTGPYYGRVRILIWIEGTDREADIALNGGEFDIKLNFIGVNMQ